MTRPGMFLVVLARNKAATLPLFLKCLVQQTYPKHLTSLYIRTNDNADTTEHILRAYSAIRGPMYASVTLDTRPVAPALAIEGPHVWNDATLGALAAIREASLRACDRAWYVVVDVDNYLRPDAVEAMVSTGLPVVAPMLACVTPGRERYINAHLAIDANGYCAPHPLHDAVRTRVVRGLLEVPVVHCTYAARADVLDKVTYQDGSGRYEYVVFSDSARRAGVAQYLDNRKDWGCLTLDETEESMNAARRYML